MKLWPHCKIVNGSPRHPQSQGSVERANNADVEKMLGKWMSDHKTKRWSVGIHFVAHKKNNRYYDGIKNIPYVLRYGQACRVGLSCMNLPENLLQKLETEEDLNSAMAEAQVLMAVTAGPVAATAHLALHMQKQVIHSKVKMLDQIMQYHALLYTQDPKKWNTVALVSYTCLHQGLQLLAHLKTVQNLDFFSAAMT
jgi:hypothetical protein